MKSSILEEPTPIVNSAPFTHATFSPGVTAHQGDIILVALDSLPKSAKVRANRQLAEGSTQGSRHVLNGGACYDADADDVSKAIRLATKCRVETQYIGPVFVGPATLEHPEHGHHIFPAGSVVAVVYQRNLDAEGRAQRSLD